MPQHDRITHPRLLELVSYDPETGFFHSRHTGEKRIGFLKESGHRRIYLDGRKYMAAPLAFFYMTGRWAQGEVDHKNRIPDDNRWSNLREASHQQNCWNRGPSKNNRSGIKGIWFTGGNRKKPWGAGICKDGKRIYLGHFATKEKAAAARQAAEKELFGEFAL